VLLVSANYRPSVGGIERYVEILAHGLAERGHRVTVAACRTHGGDAHEQDGAVEVVRIPATDVLHSRLGVPYPLPEPVSATRTLRRLLTDADVVNPQDAVYSTSALALVLARRRHVPSVLTQHVAFVPQRHRLLDAAERAALQTIGRTARLATRVVSYNATVAEWARATWKLGDVALLPAGVPEPPDVGAAEVRRSLGLPTERFLALFVGRDVPKKGLDTFLSARDPAYDLVAVTDASRPATDGVHVLPFLEPDRFRALLSSVDAFVLPSEGEGFPLALQEALISGVPCVVTHGPGYDDYLTDGDALFVPREPAAIQDALRRIASDATLRARLSERARDVGRREFGVDGFVSAYEALYSELV
jgi:glycosyltransferase involved in cell wall biosynthesis